MPRAKPTLGTPLRWGEPTRNLQAAYLFREAAGLRAASSTGQYHGAWSSVVETAPKSWQTGLYGPCAGGFSDNSNYINTGIYATSAYTVAGWICPGAASGFKNLFSFAGGGGNYTLLIFSNTFQLWSNADTTTAMGGNIWTQGEWCHFAFVRAGDGLTGGYRLFRNGVLIDSQNTGTFGTAANPWWIGSRSDGAGQYYDGQVDSLLYWNRGLSDGEVAKFAADPWRLWKRRYTPVPLWLPPVATGSLTATLGAMTASATGIAVATGAVSSTLGAATLSATGIAPATGSLSQTLGAATVSASGTATATGSLSASLGAVTLSASGTSVIAGSLSATLGAVTISSSGAAPASGSLTATLGAASLVSSGESVIAGSLSATLSPLTLSATGTSVVAGSLSSALGSLTLTASGSAVAVGSLSTTLGAVTLVSVGRVGAPVTSSGRPIRRPGNLTRVVVNPSRLSRVVRRPGSLTRVIRNPAAGRSAMPDTTIEYESMEKSVAQVRKHPIDFTKYPEIASGDTIDSVDVPAVSGITTTADGSAPTEDDYEGSRVGKFWYVTISGGTSGTDYLIKINATTVGGAVLPVWVLVQVR